MAAFVEMVLALALELVSLCSAVGDGTGASRTGCGKRRRRKKKKKRWWRYGSLEWESGLFRVRGAAGWDAVVAAMQDLLEGPMWRASYRAERVMAAAGANAEQEWEEERGRAGGAELEGAAEPGVVEARLTVRKGWRARAHREAVSWGRQDRMPG